MVDDDSTNAIDEVTSEEVVRHENTRVDNNDFLLGDEKRFVHHGQNTVNSGKITLKFFPAFITKCHLPWLIEEYTQKRKQISILTFIFYFIFASIQLPYIV